MVDIAVLGGRCKDTGPCELFGAETGEWTDLPDMTIARGPGIAAVTIPRGDSHRIYVFGGGTVDARLRSCEFLDVGTRQWILLEAESASGKTFACAVLLDHTTVVICGGVTADLSGTAICEIFDLDTHTFSPFPDMLEPRIAHAAVHYNGTIVVIAGYLLSSCEQFDPTVFKWAPFAPLNTIRHSFGAAVIDGCIYVAGCDDSIEVYDGFAWAYATMLHPYPESASAVVLMGRLVVLGAENDEINVFDPDTGATSLLPCMKHGARLSIIAVSF